jgi:hypothetical protein
MDDENMTRPWRSRPVGAWHASTRLPSSIRCLISCLPSRVESLPGITLMQ